MSWDQDTQRRGFHIALGFTALAVVALMWPFLSVLAFAAVVATVASPMHEELADRMGGQRTFAAVVTTLLVALLVLLPLGMLMYRFGSEGVKLTRLGLEWVGQGGLEARLEDLETTWEWLGADYLAPYLPEDFDVVDALADPLRRTVEGVLSAASSGLPALLGGFATGVLDAVLFVFTVITLLSDGPRLRDFVEDLVPLDVRTSRRLVGVFQEFATNSVLGMFAVALAQGTLATLGFMAFGVPRPFFFGVVTGAAGVVPIVGTGIVTLPMILWVGGLHGWGWAIGLTLYAVFIVAAVDNVIRPLVIRGSSRVHPLAIFLAVFGGMQWFGLVGVLVGPVMVAFLLALVQIKDEGVLEQQAVHGGTERGQSSSS